MNSPIETRIVDSVTPADLSPSRVRAEFQQILEEGARLHIAGEGRSDPAGLIRRYRPRARVDLFDTRYYVTGMRQNPHLRFFVGYVVQGIGARRSVYPRIFYKDVSLVWRSASHLVLTDDEIWIGKGDVRIIDRGDREEVWSVESTTDLPLELQTAFEALCRRWPAQTDRLAPRLVLRRGPVGRIEPFQDFVRLRRRAARDPRKLVNRGRPVAHFTRKNDPTSLKIIRGFEPDFDAGVIEVGASRSSLYGGRLRRHRILSINRRAQYLFFSGPRHVWIVPPQALTTELSSYGVRTVDVVVDEDLCVPGYEFHFLQIEGAPESLHSQIPPGFAGRPSPDDPDRADASAWLEQLPVIREFRRKLGIRDRARRRGRSVPSSHSRSGSGTRC